MKELLQVLLFIAKQNNIPLCYNTEDGKFYIIGDKDGELTRLHPITDTSLTVATFTPSALLTTNSAETAWKRALNGILTESERDCNGITTGLQRDNNGIATGLQRDNNAAEMEQQRAFIGAGKVNLRPFADTAPAGVAGIAANVEKLLNKAFNGTNKPATIDKLIKLHHAAEMYAKNGNIYKLRETETRLAGIVAKQGAIKTSEQTIARRAARRKLFIKIAAFLLITASTAGWFYLRRPQPPPTAASAETVSESCPTPALAAAFAEIENETGKRIYPAGRRCIENAAAAAGIENNKQAIKELIKKNLK